MSNRVVPLHEGAANPEFIRGQPGEVTPSEAATVGRNAWWTTPTLRLEALIKRLVKSGRYGSASEVVRDGLRLLQEREQFREVKLDELRKLIREGKESGSPGAWDVEEFKNEARERRRADAPE